jgi:hypothetical protein
MDDTQLLGQRVYKAAKIVFNDRRAAIDCVVRNLSDRGALLQVASPLGIPQSFDLVCGDTIAQPCHVLWCKEKQIAVEFRR